MSVRLPQTDHLETLPWRVVHKENGFADIFDSVGQKVVSNIESSKADSAVESANNIHLTEGEVSSICKQRGFIDPEKCVLTLVWTIFDPQTKQWVSLDRSFLKTTAV